MAVPAAAGAVDGLVNIFLVGLQGGLPLLSDELRGLLRPLVGIQLVVGAFALLASHLALFVGVMASILRVFLFVTLLGSFAYLSGIFIDFGIGAGLTLAGRIGGHDIMSVEEFKSPSTVLLKAFDATRPIVKWMNQQIGPSMIWNIGAIGLSVIAMLFIWASFLAIAVHLIWVLLCTYVGAAFAIIFVPFGVLGATSFLAMRSFSIVVEGTARLGLAALVTALIFPFVESFFLDNPVEVNIDIAQAFWLWAGSVLALLLSVGLPGAVVKTVTGAALSAAGMIFPAVGAVGGALMSGGGGSGGGAMTGSSGGGAGGTPPRTPTVQRNTSAGYEFY